MKIIYFTRIQSPFIVELAGQLQREMPVGTSLILNVANSLPPERAHWGNKVMSNITIENYPSDMAHYLDGHNPDIIIFTGYRAKGYNKAKKWAVNNKCKFFMYACEKLIEYKKSDLFVWLKYQIYKRKTRNVNGVMACGNRALALYQKYTDVPVINIPYTFDMTRLLNYNMLPFDGKELVFLISGRLEPFRNPIYSITVFEEIKKRFPNINMKLIISGKGSLYDTIIKMIDEDGISKDVSWMNDFESWDEIHEIYKKAHILLCLQDYGGWGLIVQEAMAAGLLVVGSSGIDAVDQLVVDGHNGIYCNLKDYSSIIDSITEMVNNPESFNKARRSARECVKYADVFFYAKRLARFIQKY